MDIRVQLDRLDLGQETMRFTARQAQAGAVVTFTGIVRDVAGGLERLEIEHYPEMTTRAITQIAERAQKRFDLNDVLVVHRYGSLLVGEVIMMVATAAPHRQSAFAGAEFLMDYLKSRAPFWKQEVSATGANWVSARASDEENLRRWEKTDTPPR